MNLLLVCEIRDAEDIAAGFFYGENHTSLSSLATSRSDQVLDANGSLYQNAQRRGFTIRWVAWMFRSPPGGRAKVLRRVESAPGGHRVWRVESFSRLPVS